jgi:RNA polymerase subunit RPABC4/transcription elongation factor Spt4
MGSEGACRKCGSSVTAGDRFCRQCGKPQVFVEMAVWKQFLLAIGTLFALVTVLGTVAAAIEGFGFETDVEMAVAEGAGGWDEVDSVDCARSSSDDAFRDRYRCRVDLHDAPCERWKVTVEPGTKIEAARAGPARDC